jgi:hypothetical protein
MWVLQCRERMKWHMYITNRTVINLLDSVRNTKWPNIYHIWNQMPKRSKYHLSTSHIRGVGMHDLNSYWYIPVPSCINWKVFNVKWYPGMLFSLVTANSYLELFWLNLLIQYEVSVLVWRVTTMDSVMDEWWMPIVGVELDSLATIVQQVT